MKAWGATARIVAIGLLALMTLGGQYHDASAQTAAPETRSFILGTGAIDGAYHPVGVALSTLIKLKLLPTLNVDLNAVNTLGTGENADLMRAGDVQFAILSALSSYEAKQGLGRFANAGPDDNLRAVAALWFDTEHVIVRKDAVESGTIDDFLALRGQTVSFGESGGDALRGNRALMASLGADIDVDYQQADLGAWESAEALGAGEIAGMSLSGSQPIGAVQRAFDVLGGDVAVLEFTDKQLALLDQGRRLWRQVVIPAGAYAGQARDIFTVGAPHILAVRGDVDDETVYQITRTIFENLDYLHGLHGTTGQITLAAAAAGLPIPVHEGALRYFREKGVDMPPPPFKVSPNLLARFENVAAAKRQVNLDRITMFTGAQGETSSRVAAELAATLSAENERFRLLPTFGGGNGQNLTDLLYLQGVDAALVRTDTIAYAAEQRIYPAVDSQLAYITEMFPEEVHLVVREEIQDIRDLAGLKVNMGAPGSGVDITASTIFSRLDVPVEMTGFSAHEALDKLRLGEIDGAFFIGGKPMPLLREIGRGQGLRLLSIPFVQYADSYRPATISREDYPQLMAASSGEEVSTLAVRTALFTYAWRPGTTRYAALGEFSRALFTHMPKLHRAGHHPKWREIDPTSEIATLNRFEPARLWIQENGDAARRIAAEGRALLEQSDRSQSAPLLIQDPAPGQEQDPQTPPSSLGAALAPKATPQPKLDQSPDHGGADEARPAPAAPAKESVIETVEPVVDPEGPLSAANGPSADRIEEPGPRGGPLTPLLARERTAKPDRGLPRIPAPPSARTPTF